jgi:hypothetical protein
MANKKTFVPVVAVLNMKGGVGKTTLSANIFRVLFERRRAGTLLLDLDPQFNLTQALFTRTSYDKLKLAGKTILPVMEPPSNVGLFDVATSKMPPPAASEINFSHFYFKSAPTEHLDIVPGDFGLVKYSLMNDSKKLDGVRDRFLRFIEQEKANYKVIHGQSTLVIPTFQKLDAMVYPQKQCKEAVSLQVEVSEYVNDIFLAYFANKWPSLPDEILKSVKSRVPSEKHAKLFS